jgi:phosphoglycolate phosphatase
MVSSSFARRDRHAGGLRDPVRVPFTTVIKERPLSFDLYLFDLDGTLVDSLPDIAGALNHALAQASQPPLPLDVVSALVGDGVAKLAEKALTLRPGAAADATALAAVIVDHYRAHPCVETRAYPGILPMLRSLKADRRSVAVLTNKPGEVARPLLAALDLASLFDSIVGDGDGYARKPDPQAASSLMARFGVAPSRTLMIGDGLPDLAVARAAGCPVAAVTWGYTSVQNLEAQHPDFLVHAPDRLLTLKPR